MLGESWVGNVAQKAVKKSYKCWDKLGWNIGGHKHPDQRAQIPEMRWRRNLVEFFDFLEPNIGFIFSVGSRYKDRILFKGIVHFNYLKI